MGAESQDGQLSVAFLMCLVVSQGTSDVSNMFDGSWCDGAFLLSLCIRTFPSLSWRGCGRKLPMHGSDRGALLAFQQEVAHEEVAAVEEIAKAEPTSETQIADGVTRNDIYAQQHLPNGVCSIFM